MLDIDIGCVTESGYFGYYDTFLNSENRLSATIAVAASKITTGRVFLFTPNDYDDGLMGFTQVCKSKYDPSLHSVDILIDFEDTTYKSGYSYNNILTATANMNIDHTPYDGILYMTPANGAAMRSKGFSGPMVCMTPFIPQQAVDMAYNLGKRNILYSPSDYNAELLCEDVMAAISTFCHKSRYSLTMVSIDKLIEYISGRREINSMIQNIALILTDMNNVSYHNKIGLSKFLNILNSSALTIDIRNQSWYVCYALAMGVPVIWYGAQVDHLVDYDDMIVINGDSIEWNDIYDAIIEASEWPDERRVMLIDKYSPMFTLDRCCTILEEFLRRFI